MAEKLMLGKAQIQGRRKEQQDGVGFNCQEEDGVVPRGGILAVVADGVGGLSHGKAASELAVRTFLQAYHQAPKHKSIHEALFFALHKANSAVCEFAKTQGAQGDCGTTLVAAAVQPQTMSLHWVSVGDSRLYLLRGQQWAQVTVDNNYAGYLMKQAVKQPAEGESEAEAEVDAEAEDRAATEREMMALTSFLGKRDLSEIDRSIRPLALEAGDWLMLCSDGLYNALGGKEMLACLHGTPQDACEALVRAALAKNHPVQDNATAAILAFHAKDRPAAAADTLSAPPPPPTSPAASLPAVEQRPSPNRRRLGWLLAALAALILLAALGWLAYRHARPQVMEAPPAAALPPPVDPAPPAAIPAKPQEGKGRPAKPMGQSPRAARH